MKRPVPNTRGFTLIETMISILALALITIGSAASLSYAGGMIQRQQLRRTAVTVATAEMEKNIRMTGLDTLEALAADSADGPVLQSTVPVEGTTYTVSTRIMNLSENADNMLLVDVQVSAPTIDPVMLRYKALRE